MMMRIVLILLVWFGFAAPGLAQDRCEGLRLSQLIDPRSPDYDPDQGVDEPIRLTVSRTATNGNCRFFINIVSDAAAGRDRYFIGGGGEQLRYEIVDESGQVLENTTRGRDRLKGRLRRNETEIELLVRFVVPSGQTVPAGDYSERLTLRLFDQRGGGRLVDEAGLTLRTQVASLAEINLAQQPGLDFDSGRSYDQVDFEELETGESRAIVLRVRSNASYRLSLSSENSGVLVRDGSGGADRIGYSAQLDGDPVTLNAPVLLLRDPLAVGAVEELIFNVVIGDVGEARAGRYADMITVFVEPVR